MGCPDWPKCFGYYITEKKELLLQHKRNMIGSSDHQRRNVLVAKTDFTSKQILMQRTGKNTPNTITLFQPNTHLGRIHKSIKSTCRNCVCLITLHLLLGIGKKIKHPLLTFSVCVLMGRMLGKTVVDSDLSPYKITTLHACCIVDCSLQLIVIHSTQNNKKIVGYNSIPFYYYH
jgi:cytochrome c oxidase assembly protein subunit 15